MSRKEPASPPLLDADWVRSRLPPFTHETTDLSEPALGAYRSFYKIEFEKEFPGLSISIGLHRVSGYKIALHHYRQLNSAAGTVFLLHGYYDHVGIFNHVLRALIGAGHSVVTFDLPGHGLSSGDKVAIPDFHRYQIIFRHVLGFFSDQAAKPWSVVAQSTGGAIAIDCLLDHATRGLSLPFRRAALLAPLLRPRGYALGRYVHQIVSPFSDYVKRGFARNSHSEEFLKFLRNIDPLQSRHLSAKWVGALKEWVPVIESSLPSDFPLLVIQGQQDGTVDFEHNLLMLRKKFPVMEVVLIAAARHQLVNESEDLRGEIFHNTLRYLRS